LRGVSEFAAFAGIPELESCTQPVQAGGRVGKCLIDRAAGNAIQDAHAWCFDGHSRHVSF
jgi:hypothetical protein